MWPELELGRSTGMSWRDIYNCLSEAGYPGTFCGFNTTRLKLKQFSTHKRAQIAAGTISAWA